MVSLNVYSKASFYAISKWRTTGHLATIGRSDNIASSAVVRQRNGGVGVGEEGSEGGGRDALSPHCEEPFSLSHRNVIASRRQICFYFRWINCKVSAKLIKTYYLLESVHTLYYLRISFLFNPLWTKLVFSSFFGTLPIRYALRYATLIGKIFDDPFLNWN